MRCFHNKRTKNSALQHCPNYQERENEVTNISAQKNGNDIIPGRIFGKCIVCTNPKDRSCTSEVIVKSSEKRLSCHMFGLFAASEQVLQSHKRPLRKANIERVWDLNRQLVIPSTEKFKTSFFSDRYQRIDRIWFNWR